MSKPTTGSKPAAKAGTPTSPYALSNVRSRLPRQLMWALIIAGVSFGVAVLTSH